MKNLVRITMDVEVLDGAGYDLTMGRIKAGLRNCSSFDDNNNLAYIEAEEAKDSHSYEYILSMFKKSSLFKAMDLYNDLNHKEKLDMKKYLTGSEVAVDDLFKFLQEPLKTVDLDNNEDGIHISCPHCSNWEEQPIDQQRHHLQTFDIVDWDEEGELEVSVMECHCCKNKFKQKWNYKESYDYFLDVNESMCLVGNLDDVGCVQARSKKEAKELAMKELKPRIEAINALLAPSGTQLSVNLYSIVVELAQ